jgi:alpha-tubulin suppressor-like RCC1 family protein
MCWGSDGRGALGDGGGFGGSSQVPVPVDFQGATVNVRGIDASTNFACAVVDEEIGAMTVMGKVKCWGDNTEGQLGAGLPTNQVSTFPVDVIDAITMTPIEGAVGISTGRLHACAVLQDGSLKCWGQNNSQQLGSTTAAARQTTAVVADRLSAVNVLGVSAGEANTCAVLEGNIAACWGFNMSFKNGNGIETGNQVTPHPVLVVP